MHAPMYVRVYVATYDLGNNKMLEAIIHMSMMRHAEVSHILQVKQSLVHYNYIENNYSALVMMQ